MGADVTTFTDTSVVVGTSYWYRVQAYNATTASAYSNVATGVIPVVATAPVFTTQPIGSAVNTGASVSFSVVASGSPAPAFQWYKDGVSLSGATASTLSLASVTALNAGTYTVVASNSAGSVTSSSAILVVNTLPVITTQPLGSTVNAGANVSFSMSASGSPAPTYQWFKDGVIVNNATTSILSLAGVTTASAGSYKVVVTNSVGSVTSNAAVLVVNTLPTITSQPIGQVCAIGGSVTFSVAVAGSPTPTVQWRKDGASILGATSNTLTISSVTLSSAGTYSVVATNSAGSTTSSGATLTVTCIAPTFTLQPASQVVTSGQTLTLSAAASGSPTPTLQWFKDGVSLSGATTGTLTVANVTALNAGSYTIVASNAGGAITSSAAIVAVNTPPVITTQPIGSTVNAGANVSLSVTVTGSPAPTYQWFKDGVSISNANASTLSLASVTSATAGSYKVVVTNTVGTVTSNSAVLVVNTLPVITSQPAAQACSVGQSVTFSVSVSGSPMPVLQWRKDGAPIAGATSTSLTMSNVTLANAGTYSVVATNSAGSTTSNGAALTVTGTAPTFTLQPVGQTIKSGETLTLTVAVTGSPTPTLQWKKDGVALIGATSTTYSVVDVAGSSAGTYTVVATNDFGSATSTSAVVTLFTPGRLTAVSARAVSAPWGSGALQLGFTIRGAQKSVLVRAVGPGLASFTTTAVSADPTLKVMGGTATVASNDNWGGTTALSDTFARVGAFPLATASKDAALVTSLAPQTYLATIGGTASGLALAEIFDADTTVNLNASLASVNARGSVGTGDAVLNAGFVISGNTSVRVLVRAIGPSLTGLQGLLKNPILSIYRDNQLIASNDNWGGTTALSSLFQKVGATPLSSKSKDAAVDVTLAPGVYSAVVTGLSGSTGLAQVEFYVVP